MSFDIAIKDGDIAIGTNGDLQQIQNTPKLVQDMLKMVITPLGSNFFHPWYGSPISKSLIGTSLDMTFISTIAEGQLSNALQTLQKLQNIQASYQVVSPSEQIAAIQQVSVVRNPVDPRYFTITIQVIAKDLSTPSAQFSLNTTL